MSNAIPPLLCSTPPPIDFANNNEKDDDFGGFDSNEFHQFNGPSLPTTPRHDLKKSDEIPDLPIPDDTGFPSFSAKSISCDTKAHDIPSSEKNDIKSCVITESKLNKIKEENTINSEINPKNVQHSDQEENQYEENISDMLKSETIFHKTNNIEENSEIVISAKSSRSESPQSLELSAQNLSSEDNESVGDFQEAELKYDDNTSLPSLNFDSINISKNASPNFQEDKPSPNESPTKEVKSLAENINSSAFQTTTTVDSCQKTFESSEKTQTDEIRNTEYCEVNTGLEDDDFNDFASASITENIETVPLGEIIFKPDINNEDDDGDNDDNSDNKCQSEPIDDCWNTDDNDNDFNDFEAFTPGPSIFNNTENNDKQTIQIEVKSEPLVFSSDFNQSQPLYDKIEKPDDKLPVEAIKDNQLENEFLNEESMDNKDEDIVRATFKNTEVDDDFEDFQEFSESVSKSNEDPNPDKINADVDNEDNDDDDDFGDFSDFKEAPPTVQLVNPFTSLQFTSLDDRLKPILNMMFPNQEDGNNIKSKDTNSEDINNNLISNLKEVEAAKALEYQWSNSNVKHSLIKALGIDSRNILYGEKWNSSMPKFASNLGFSPLEPLKPVQINGGATGGSGQMITSKGETIKRSGNEVPAVQFDWNSSGLVNPLDGVKEILHERKTEKIYPSEPSDIDQHSEPQSSVEMTVPSSSASNRENSSVIIPKDTNSISVCTNLPEFNNNLNVGINLSEDKETTNNNHKAANSDNIINNVTEDTSASSLRTKSSLSSTYVVPLKETHIFTPSKGENTIARSVKSCDTKCPIDFDYEMAAAGIIIDEQVVKKEYRDIEYNPEKLTFDIGSGLEVKQTDNDFDIESYDRYREDAASSNIIINENLATIPNLDNNNKNMATNFKWDFDSPTNSKSDEQISSDSFTDFQSGPNTITEILSSMTSSDQPNKTLDITTELKINTDNTTTIANGFCDFTKTNKYTGNNYSFSKPTIGISPTENANKNNVQGIDSKTITKTTTTSNNSFDDEFSDFQSVPPPLPSHQSAVQIPTGTSGISSNIDPARIKSYIEEKPKSRTETPTFSDEMILSPAVLLPQSIRIESNPQINWPEPGINPDELARLEELFPQPKQTKQSPIRTNQLHQQNHHHQSSNIPQANDQPKEQKNSIINDDDDWSEFVSVPIAQNDISSIKKRSPQQQNQQQSQSITSLSISKLVNTSPDDDDWSDFVSSEPSAGSNYSSWRTTINHIPPSQYTSWNQSHLPKQYFHQGQLYQHHHHQQQHQQPQHQQQQQQPQHHQPSNLVPTTNPNNVFQINNNNNSGQSFIKGGYSVVSGNPHHQNFQLHQQFQSGQQQLQHQQQQQHQQRNQPQAVLKSQLNKAPSISLIPDLGFVAPRSFINVPRNNYGKK